VGNRLISAAKAPELIKKLWITLGLIVIYRLGVFIPTPGVNTFELSKLIQGTNLFGMFNLFSGGALERFSIFALGIMPYISASIIFSLLTVVSTRLSQLQKEGGELGRKKITEYTRYATVVIAVIQAFGIATWLQNNPGGHQIVEYPGWKFQLLSVITLTSGTVFIMWLGEQITQRGIGNGTSLIIFTSIVAHFPQYTTQLFSRTGEQGDFGMGSVLTFGVLALAAVAFIVFMERAQRRIPIHHAKKVVGRQVFGAQTQFLPLKINMAGVIPPIFASSILLFPGTLATFFGQKYPVLQRVSEFFQPGTSWVYNTVYVSLIVFFCFFYTAIQFNPDDVADNIKKSGGFVPGLRPGKSTSEYLDKVLTRLTAVGAVYISFVCVAPFFAMDTYQIFLGGTSILIVVGVAMNFIEQVQAHLLSVKYDSFLGDNVKPQRRFNRRGG